VELLDWLVLASTPLMVFLTHASKDKHAEKVVLYLSGKQKARKKRTKRNVKKAKIAQLQLPARRARAFQK
jgi:hypothetical protein